MTYISGSGYRIYPVHRLVNYSLDIKHNPESSGRQEREPKAGPYRGGVYRLVHD